MSRSSRPLDVRDLQRAMLETDMRAEQESARAARQRALPPPRWPDDTRGAYEIQGTRRAPQRPEAAVIDVHEMLKREAFGVSQPACDDHFEKNKPCPAGVYGVSDQYMVLDSFLKLRESAVDRGEFRWNFMVQGVTGDEVLGVRDRIDTVIEIQVGAFGMPVPPEVPYVLAAPPIAPTGTDQLVLLQNNTNLIAPFSPTLVPNAAPFGQYPPALVVPPSTTIIPWINNPYTQVPFFDRITIQLKEAGLQSFSDRNGARHHYEFTLASTTVFGSNPNMLIATPQTGSMWDTFIFTDPLKDVHGLTLVFRNPDVPIRFLPDCLYDASVESDASAAPGPYLRVRAPGHGLNAGDRIYISGFQSGNSKLDSYINRADGQVAAGDPAAPLAPGVPIVLPDPDVFYLDPAPSLIDFTVQVPVLPQVVTVCIAKRRMRIPIRMRRVVSRLTNYISP